MVFLPFYPTHSLLFHASSNISFAESYLPLRFFVATAPSVPLYDFVSASSKYASHSKSLCFPIFCTTFQNRSCGHKYVTVPLNHVLVFLVATSLPSTYCCLAEGYSRFGMKEEAVQILSDLESSNDRGGRTPPRQDSIEHVKEFVLQCKYTEPPNICAGLGGNRRNR